jgi:multicomponent Na+:H+ antiporter subunit D
MSDQFPILIVVIPLFFGLTTPLLGGWRRDLCQPWVVLALGLAGLSAAGILFRVITSGPVHYYLGSWMPPWGIEFVIDPLNALMLVAVTLIAFLVAVYSRQSIRRELPGRTVYFYTVYLL